MKNIERWFYLIGIAVLGILLLFNWKCQGRCPEITTINTSDTIYLPQKTDSAKVIDPIPVSVTKKKINPVFTIDTTGGWVLTIDSNSIGIDDLIANKLYDSTYKFANSDVRVITEVEQNSIKRQEVFSTYKTQVITNTETKTVTNTVYEGRRQIYIGANLYGTKNSWLNGIGGSVMYKTKKDLCFEGGVFKLNSLPVQYTFGTKLKINLK